MAAPVQDTALVTNCNAASPIARMQIQAQCNPFMLGNSVESLYILKVLLLEVLYNNAHLTGVEIGAQ